MRAKYFYNIALLCFLLSNTGLFILADDTTTSSETTVANISETASNSEVSEHEASVSDEAAGIHNVLSQEWHEIAQEWYAWVCEEHPYLGASGLATFVGTLLYMLSQTLRSEAVIEVVKSEMTRRYKDRQKITCDCAVRGCSCLVKGKCPCSKDRKGCGCSKSRKKSKRLTRKELMRCPFLKMLMQMSTEYEGGCPYVNACMNK